MSAGLRQPLRGLAATVVAVGGAMLIVSLVAPATMATWLTLCVSAAIPFQFIVAVMWHHEWPGPIARLRQPAKGLTFIALFAVVGAVASGLALFLLGGGIMPPNPVPIAFVIYAVQVTIWLVVGFGGWPASMIASPLTRTAATLALAYLVTFVLFRLLFNFSHIAHAPFYVAALDPHGTFVAWGPIAFTMATVGVLLSLVYFDMQPFTAIAARWPALGRQPVFGLMLLAFAVVAGGSIFVIGTRLLASDLVIFLARIDVAYVFGALMVINLFDMGRFVALPQPWRGLVLIAATLVLAAVIVPLFRLVAAAAFGRLSSGPPAYDFELWVASALLAITFPLMSLYSGAFEFWPFASRDGIRG